MIKTKGRNSVTLRDDRVVPIADNVQEQEPVPEKKYDILVYHFNEALKAAQQSILNTRKYFIPAKRDKNLRNKLLRNLLPHILTATTDKDLYHRLHFIEKETFMHQYNLVTSISGNAFKKIKALVD